MSDIKYDAVRYWHSQGLSIDEIIEKCKLSGIKSKHGTIPGKSTIHDWIHGKTIESRADYQEDPVDDLFSNTSVDGVRVLDPENRGQCLSMILSWHRDGLTSSEIIARCNEHYFVTNRDNQPSNNNIRYWIRRAEELEASTHEELTEDSEDLYQVQIRALEQLVDSLIDGFCNLVDAHCGLADDFKRLNK
jgi:hypothetical protein|tara:strand:+ start:42 stop:611 length:570 start_codon:yes stop_codon:yes gene_type:complete